MVAWAGPDRTSCFEVEQNPTEKLERLPSAWKSNLWVRFRSSDRTCSPPWQGKLSTSDALVLLSAAMLSHGALRFPGLFARVGCRLGTLLLCASCAISAYLCIVMNSAIGRLQAQGQVTQVGYRVRKLPDLGHECFGNVGKKLTQAVVGISLVFNSAECLLVIGQSLTYIRDPPAYRGWIVIFTFLSMPAAFLRDVQLVKKIAYVSLGTTGVYLVGIAGVSITAAIGQESAGSDRDPGQVHSDSICFFGILIHMMLPFAPFNVMTRVRSEMQRPEEFNLVLVGSHLLALILPLVGGVVGLWGFGPSVHEMVLVSCCGLPGCPGTWAELRGGGESVVLKTQVESASAEVTGPGEKWIFGYVLAAAVSATLATKLAIYLFMLSADIEDHWPINNPIPIVPNLSMRVGVLVLAAMLGLFVPYLPKLVCLVAVLAYVPGMCFLPVLFDWKSAKAISEPGVCWRNVFHMVVLLFGLAWLAAGSWHAAWELWEAVTENPNQKWILTFTNSWFNS